MTPRYKNDNRSGQFRNQRTMNVVGAKENIGKSQKGLKTPRIIRKRCCCANKLRKDVPIADSGTDSEPLEKVQNDTGYNVFSNELQHSEQSESISNTCLVETNDNNVILDSPDMCDDDIQNDQNDVESNDERVALANLIANLKLDIDENKKIQKQLKKANKTLAQKLKECKTILAKNSKTLRESNSVRDSCLVALQNKQTEFEKYKAFNDRTVDYDKLERKLNETLGQLAQKHIEIKEGLKLKAYEILLVKEKHDELIKQSLLTKSHYEGLVKQKTKVIMDLKLKEEHDIDKMLSLEKQLKFLNKIVNKRNQSIQTIHMMAPKVPSYNGRPTFANPRHLKQAQSKIPCSYVFPYDQSTHANRLIPDGEETLALKRESRSKLNKNLVRPYDYTKLNSLYEILKPPTQEFEIQLAHVNEVRRKMWRKYFVKYKPNIFKNIGFLSVSKSISKSRQAYNVMTNNINHFKEIVDNAWVKRTKDQFRAPTAQDMDILFKTCLMPLALKTQNDSFIFVHELNELKKLIEKCKGKYVETKFDKPSIVRQPNAQRIPKPSVLRKLAPFSDSLERKYFSKTKSVPKTNVLEGVNHKTNVSRPQHRSNQMKDKVVPNNNQKKLKKTQVEDHPRIPSIPNKSKSVTVCNDSLNSRTSNGNVVCPTCGKYLVDSDHFACVTKILNDVNARTKKPNVVLISTRKPKGHTNKSVATPHKKKVASKSNTQKPKSYNRTMYEKTSKTWKWWIEQQCPSRYKWVPEIKMQWIPKVRNENVQKRVSFAIDNAFRITNHMMGNLKLLCNFVEKYLGTVRFGNDQFAPILGYGDLVQGNITINMVYYIEGLNHNLFSVGHFCDADLEVAFWKSTCFVRDL
uniref:Retrovirus-related Pol polyprotein from transposon TNT 1-94-like beta-barrel domain-containing protein n=1 Tax=Tanacetum cinerariifolium TaxID=118510 RepID=A0A6L2MSH6_TANCI|nr:hypothetical protein [Tanacetum cinerariifolium]